METYHVISKATEHMTFQAANNMFKIETVSTIANHIIQVVDVNVNGSSIVFDTVEDATKAIIEFSKLDNGTFFDDVASVAVVPVLTVSN